MFGKLLSSDRGFFSSIKMGEYRSPLESGRGGGVWGGVASWAPKRRNLSR